MQQPEYTRKQPHGLLFEFRWCHWLFASKLVS
jgi:hypothetical protein